MSQPKTIKIPCVGYEIAADWYEGTFDGVLLVLPGYESTKLKYSDMISAITEQSGVSALVIDYSGHGESPFDLGDLTRAQNFSECVKAFDWIRENHPDKKITVMGTSYGGFHAAYLTKFRKFDNIIFRVPASYPEESLYSVYKTMDDRHGGDYRFTKENYIDHWLFTHTDSISGRALVITHELDDVCPPVSTMPFTKAFNADHWDAPGFKHGFGESDITEEQKTEYHQYIVDWIQK